MKAGINRYRVDLRELEFVLFEQFKVTDLVGKEPFQAWGEEECREILKQAVRFVTAVLGPLNEVGDRQGCRLENGQVKTPPGFDQAWKALYDAGYKSLGLKEEIGGQGAPRSLVVLVEELLSGANTAFAMYPGLTAAAAEMIEEFATAEQKERWLPRMLAGEWSGTMCLTEPQAGSDVGAAATVARRNPDGTYSIRGTKIFISGGDSDLVSNVVHAVLARVEGAPAGTKGLSLFIVPKVRVQADGSLGQPNDVAVTGIEHKLGINGSSTCTLSFGENDGCVGELVGTVEGQGIAQMFKMMNFARLLVGIQGLSVASSAYLNALDYARERKQGPAMKNFKDPAAPKVSIIEHADVRRMLLDMKAKVEAVRAMVVKLARHADLARALSRTDKDAAAYHQGQVDLLTPLVKAYGSDEAFQVCATAIQVYGGAGFTKDYPVEQGLRDSKVFSIYEGTNHIQAMDLVSRKLTQAGGAPFRQFMGDVAAFVEANQGHAGLGSAVKALSKAQAAVGAAALALGGFAQAGKLDQVALSANRFLQMMAELTCGWLLLDAAVIADRASQALGDDHPDRRFYAGKRHAAEYYARNVLPKIAVEGQLLAAEDRSALDIGADCFATV